MATGTDRMENAEMDRLVKEVNGHLGRARALLAMAHRHAAKMPLTPEDQEKSRSTLADSIGQCVAATHLAKANNLYRLADSGLNPSELRRSVERAITQDPNSKSVANQRGTRTAPPKDGLQASLFAQLDFCRRINLEGLRWLTQSGAESEAEWRGRQLLKIAEQLCVVTALESKLLGLYPMGDSSDDAAVVRRTISEWATEATRREIAEE